MLFFSFCWQLYPYHLQDILVQGLRMTPFNYYCSMMHSMVHLEKSYDALPNFTAADCKGGREEPCALPHPARAVSPLTRSAAAGHRQEPVH